MKRISIVLFLCVWAVLSSWAQTYKYEEIYTNLPFAMPKVEAPRFPDLKVSLPDFGAVGNGVELCTEAFEKAIETLSSRGGGHLIVPAGIWLTGPIVLKSNIDLHIEKGAVVLFSPDVELYPLVETVFEGLDTRRCQSPVSGRNLTNVAITGQGAIDGNGHFWRPLKREKVTESVWKQTIARGGVYKRPTYWFPYPQTLKGDTISNMNVPQNLTTEEEWQSVRHFLRPVMVSLIECKNVWLQGVIFQNSPAWNLHPLMCENVLIEGVTILNSPMWELNPVLCTNFTARGVHIDTHGYNNDGCDPENCNYVLIEDCYFNTGDDCIAVKAGRNRDGRELGEAGFPTQNLIIRNNIFADGHGGIACGSEMSGGIKNLFADNNTFDSPNLNYALRFKTNAQRGGAIENVYLRTSKVKSVGNAVVHATMLYDVGRDGDYLPQFKNITIET